MTATLKVVDGDVVFSSATGRPLIIEGKDKLRQDVRQNLDTETQRNGTGADLDGVVGLIGDVFSLRAEISRRVNDSFASLRKVQEGIQRFDRTPAERLGRVVQVVVVPLRDPQSGSISNTTFAYRVDVLSVEGGTPVTVSGALVR